MRQLTGSSKNQFLIIVIFSMLTLLPGLFSIPVTDVDEARFAQASKQMLETHQFEIIKIQNTNRHLKPPGIYWLQSAATVLSQKAPFNQIFSYRLPSFIATMLITLLIFVLGRQLFTRETAFLSSVIFCCMLGVGYEATFSSTDAVFSLCIFVMQFALAQIYLKNHNATHAPPLWPAVFWICMAFGVFIKGLSPLFALSTVIFLKLIDGKNILWGKKLRPLYGLTTLIILTLSWLIPFSILGHSNFLYNMIQSDLLPKITGGQQHHGAPPGYYILLLSVLAWPMSLYIIPTCVFAKKNFNNKQIKFLIAWIVPNWLIFSLVPTKLPQYILPLMPAIAYLMAAHLQHLRQNSSDALSKKMKITAGFVWLFYNLIICIGLLTLIHKNLGFNSKALLFTAAIVCCNATLAMRFYFNKQILSSIVTNAVSAALFYSMVFYVILPNPLLWTSHRVGKYLNQPPFQTVLNHTPLQVIGYSEPSLIFEVGTKKVLFTSIDHIKNSFNNNHEELILISNKKLLPFKKFLTTERHNNTILLQSFSGFDLNHGKKIALYLYYKKISLS